MLERFDSLASHPVQAMSFMYKGNVNLGVSKNTITKISYNDKNTMSFSYNR